MFSLKSAYAVIAIRKRFLEENERYKGFHEANMRTVLDGIYLLLDKSK